MVAFLFLVTTCTASFIYALDHELEANEKQNLQWVEDAKNGKPYTNFNE